MDPDQYQPTKETKTMTTTTEEHLTTAPTAPPVTVTFPKGTLARMVAAVKCRAYGSLHAPIVGVRIDATGTRITTDDLETRRAITVWHDTHDGAGHGDLSHPPVTVYADLGETVTAAKGATTLTVTPGTVTYGSDMMRADIDTLPPEGDMIRPRTSDPVTDGATHSVTIPLVALTAAHKTASTDQARPILASVLIDRHNDQAFLVATDSYRLLALEIRTEYDGRTTADPYLVPIDAITAALKIAKAVKADEVTVTASDGTDHRTITIRMAGTVGAGTVEAVETAGAFPPYRKLIPATSEQMAPVIVDQYRDALKSTGKGETLVAITANAPAYGAAVTLRNPAGYGDDGAPIATLPDLPGPDEGTGAGWPTDYAVAFRASFLVDAMPPAPEAALLTLNTNPLKPATIEWYVTGMTGFALIMPVRIA